MKRTRFTQEQIIGVPKEHQAGVDLPRFDGYRYAANATAAISAAFFSGVE